MCKKREEITSILCNKLDDFERMIPKLYSIVSWNGRKYCVVTLYSDSCLLTDDLSFGPGRINHNTFNRSIRYSELELCQEESVGIE